jgi:hypothetical protein
LLGKGNFGTIDKNNLIITCLKAKSTKEPSKERQWLSRNY